MIGQTVICAGMKIKLTCMERNHAFAECKKCSTYCKEYNCCPYISRAYEFNLDKVTPKQLISTIVELEITNCNQTTTERLRNILLFDTKGKVYEASYPPCDEVRSGLGSIYDRYPPMSITKIRIYFPELPRGTNVSKIAFCLDSDDKVEFFFEPYDAETLKLFCLDEGEDIQRKRISDEAERRIKETILDLSKSIEALFRRAYNAKDEDNCIALVEHYISTIQKEYPKLIRQKRISVEKEVDVIVAEYRKRLASLNEQRRQNDHFAIKASRLLSLSPREFELWCGEFFELLGFDSEVTPATMDKGIDIYLYKSGIRYAVQCKKYKGTVSTPDIQKLIGAMVTQNVSYGIFITTGTFSIGAEAMCKKNNIKCYDIYEIAEEMAKLHQKGEL